MLLQGFEILEGIHFAQIAGMNQAHEQITDVSPMFGFIKQRVFAVKDRLFQRALTEVIVQRSLWHPKEQCEFFPVVEHVRDGLS